MSLKRWSGGEPVVAVDNGDGRPMRIDLFHEIRRLSESEQHHS